jgi:hypothetical protein
MTWLTPLSLTVRVLPETTVDSGALLCGEIACGLCLCKSDGSASQHIEVSVIVHPIDGIALGWQPHPQRQNQ